jgi:hypothetical protein
MNKIYSKNVGIYVVCALGFIFTTFSYYPGLMTSDSDHQYLQASSFIFSDWHPPIMSLVWSALLKIVDGPLGLFVLFGLMYWGSFLSIASSLAMKSKFAAITLLLFAYSPIMLNYMGTIWKDVFVTVFFLLGLALILRSYATQVPLNLFQSFFILLIISIGSLARHNSILTGLVLSILCVIYTKTIPTLTIEKIYKKVAIGVLAYIVVLGSTLITVNHITNPKKEYASSSLFVYDLVGISIRANEYLLPKSNLYDVHNIIDCYEDKGWDKIYVACPSLLSEIRADGNWQFLGRYWMEAIYKHPVQYLKHRYRHFTSFFRSASLKFIDDKTTTQLSKDFGFKSTSGFLFLQDYILRSTDNRITSLLYTNGFWILLSFATTIIYFLCMIIKFDQSRLVLFLISFSGFVYASPLIMIGVAPDFRYVYWTITSSLICFSLSISLILQRFQRKRLIEK